MRLYSEDPDVTWSGFAECGSSKCGGVLAVEEIKIYRRDSFSDMRTKTENMILERCCGQRHCYCLRLQEVRQLAEKALTHNGS